jgi:xanthine dehydrogenase accessory factor
MTHDHAEDFALCDAALRLPQPLGGVGLIGSSVKWTRFQAQLADLGHSPEAIATITCPIGQPRITGKDPAVIAVAVAAALLEALPASQRAAAPPGLRSDEGATREGGASRRPGGEREKQSERDGRA